MRRSRTAVDDAAPALGTGTALSLTASGALVLLAAFALLNEWFGVHVRSWPWDFLADGDQDLRLRALYGLALLAGLWAFLLSFTRVHRLRSSVLIALVAVLFVECALALRDLGVRPYEVYPLLLLTGLGAGLLLAREEGTRGIGRVLAGVGAVAFVWSLASTFDSAEGASQLERWWAEVTADLGDPTADDHLWRAVLPRSLFLVAAACGVLAVLGVRHRLFLWIAFGLVGAGLLAPVGVTLCNGIDVGLGAQALADEAVTALVASGFLLWLLGAYALFDAGRGRTRAS